MSRPVKLLLKYGITVLACLLVGGLYLLEKDFFNVSQLDQYRLLSDAFSLPGLMCLFFGLSIWMSNEGAFDAVSWVVTYAVKSLFPGGRATRETYGDYVVRQRGKKKKEFSVLLIVGAAEVAVSLIILSLFYRVR